MFKNRIKKTVLRGAAEFCVYLIIAAAAYFITRNFIMRTGRVAGVSMEPTLNHGDLVLINRAVYILGEPKAGDIVAFPYPANPGVEYVKRVVGLAGDEVDYISGYIYINGEPYTPDSWDGRSMSYNNSFPLTVPDGHVFVLGDNSWASEDSRFREVGCVPVSSIVGKVVLRLSPVNKIGFLNSD